jgi:hypothetical protein
MRTTRTERTTACRGLLASAAVLLLVLQTARPLTWRRVFLAIGPVATGMLLLQ